MKIAILVLMFPPRWLAGTEIATHNIARHLAKRGHDVHIITSWDEGLPRESQESGFCVHRVKIPGVRYLGIALFWLRALLRLWRLKPNLVQSQGIGMGVPAFVGKGLWRTPYLVWGRGTLVYASWVLKTPISRLALGNADAVIALTQDMKQALQKTCRRPVGVIGNGIDLEGYQALPAKAVVREELGLGADEKVITFVGTLRPVKGLEHLVAAMNIIGQKDATARLLLVGDGEERQKLEAMVRDWDLGGCVQFAGRVPNERVPHYLSAADVFVLPSLSEGFPNVVLEAMAAGLPVVASRVGGLPEIIEDGQNGFLVEPGTSDELAETILLLLGDDQLRARISANNREKAKAYTWESVVDRLEEVHRSIVGP